MFKAIIVGFVLIALFFIGLGVYQWYMDRRPSKLEEDIQKGKEAEEKLKSFQEKIDELKARKENQNKNDNE